MADMSAKKEQREIKGEYETPRVIWEYDKTSAFELTCIGLFVLTSVGMLVNYSKHLREQEAERAGGLFRKDLRQNLGNHGAIPYGSFCLINAITDKRINDAKNLIMQGANVSASSSDGVTPLMYAAAFGDISLIELMVAKGADITRQDKHGLAPLDYAVKAHNTAVIKIIKQKRNEAKQKEPVKVSVFTRGDSYFRFVLRQNEHER